MRSLTLIAAVAALAVLPSVASAQTTITACYVPKSGSVYRIKVDGAPAKCAQNHVEFSWETGVQQMYGYVTTVDETITVQPGTLQAGAAYCGEGYLAISGGYMVMDQSDTGPNLQILTDTRLIANPGWVVSARNLGSEAAEIRIDVQCIQFNP
ncbi:MAG TPA: hypothetical protein VFU00_11460 [Gemmatimonadales bacterium]|nr:hypothetical protein [Gemmatimonadales bacterium]